MKVPADKPAAKAIAIPVRTLALGLAGAAALLLLASLLLTPLSSLLVAGLADHAPFFGLGVLGAIFANSTGAGGGVVFIPMFDQLGFSEGQAVATSFGIQCFGMTAGALSWSHAYRSQHRPVGAWQAFLPATAIAALCSILGLWAVYGFGISSPGALGPMFGGFSLLLGAAILLTALALGAGSRRNRLSPVDLVAIPAIALGGGAVTAWLSVGVGEFLAFYLILRRYDVAMSVAVACAVTALTVWSAAPQHLFAGGQADWQVLAYAGPGAIAGGLIARHLVTRLGANRLKLFFGGWLLVIGLAEFLVAA